MPDPGGRSSRDAVSVDISVQDRREEDRRCERLSPESLAGSRKSRLVPIRVLVVERLADVNADSPFTATRRRPETRRCKSREYMAQQIVLQTGGQGRVKGEKHLCRKSAAMVVVVVTMMTDRPSAIRTAALATPLSIRHR